MPIHSLFYCIVFLTYTFLDKLLNMNLGALYSHTSIVEF